MKRLIQLLAIVSVVGVMALLSGCEKENLGGKRAFKEVVFGATAHSSLDTRTEYMNYDQTKDHQNIKWLATDKIRIYSPDAARRVAVEAGENPSNYYYWADYLVVPNNNNPTLGTLQNLNADGHQMAPSNPGYTPSGISIKDTSKVSNGLVWLNKNAVFYGAYPRKALLGKKDGKGLDVADGKFGFTIPKNQSFSVKGDMDYAFMTAKASASEGDPVDLKFYPDFTAFEISIKCEAQGSDVTLNSFTIGTNSTENSDILNGDFTVDLTGAQKSYTFQRNNIELESRKKITVSNINQTIPAGSSATPLVFTVFALPDSLRNLYVEFNTTTGGAAKTWKLDLSKKDANDDYQPIEFGACKKHRIYGLVLPNGELLISVNTAPWVAGDEFAYTTIENITTGFQSVQRYDKDGDYSSWDIPGTYIGIAKGIEGKVPVDPDDPSQGTITTNRPLNSPMFTLKTISVGVDLQLKSDNPNFKFVVPLADGTFSSPRASLTIAGSTNIHDEKTTNYFVVAEDATPDETTNIRLIRMDNGVPVAYSHSDLPGSVDHTKVPFILLSAEKYATTRTIVPSI